MGLDVFAASHLRFARAIPKGKAWDALEQALEAQNTSVDEAYFVLHANAAAHRARLGGMRPGLYEYAKGSRRHGFRAGSYTGYNRWRELLCQFALDTDPEEVWARRRAYLGRPFVELIDFTDCDGRIGTTVAAKLAKDFDSHARRAKRYAESLTDPDDWDGESFLSNYRDFARALRLAAKDGALTFC